MLNNYIFAKKLDQFKEKILDPQIAKTQKAEKIMHDNTYQWESEDKKKIGQQQYDSYKAWLAFYKTFYEEGMNITTQHENLVNLLAKWYDSWYKNISNDGKQETEMMSMQADMLSQIFAEIYKELQPLKLDIKPPIPMNL